MRDGRMWACAVVRVVGSILERFEKQGFQVLFIGHSLGAGNSGKLLEVEDLGFKGLHRVSAIAGAVCRLGIEGPKLTKVRSLCYATPAVGNGVYGYGSFGKFCEGHATTVINCEDVAVSPVPRLSLETARKLRDELLSRKDIDALKDLNNLTEKKTPATLRAGISR
ncbi:hypothetical protein AK812_SmicGene1529 [Symbiodinium microadriaticum]|uniref:Uncharacterized protein n=1 Tax=Symbiodinium microadriaticum TaxID=2951 RepID=A0A1Q9F3Z4_SYMMI|nr:hypothetical protein AK812_SmicGene1529 [Symbiodinium microadriaticum]